MASADNNDVFMDKIWFSSIITQKLLLSVNQFEKIVTINKEPEQRDRLKEMSVYKNCWQNLMELYNIIKNVDSVIKHLEKEELNGFNKIAKNFESSLEFPDFEELLIFKDLTIKLFSKTGHLDTSRFVSQGVPLGRPTTTW